MDLFLLLLIFPIQLGQAAADDETPISHFESAAGKE